MAQQHINLGTAPDGADGDTNRTAHQKWESNFNELYDALDAIGVPVGRNLLINAQGRINQRVFAGGALAAGVYGYDRWKAGAGGCIVTVNASTGVFTHTSGALVQVIEAPRCAGQAVTFSVDDPSGPVGVNVEGVVGAITAGAGRQSVTLTVPVGSTGNVTLTIIGAGVTYRNPQLEIGEVPTAFESRPLGLELILCQRYYEKSYNLGTAPGAVTSTGRLANFTTAAGLGHTVTTRFSTTKRAAPAVTVYATSTGAAGNVSQSDGSNLAATIQALGESGFELTFTNGAGLFGGRFQFVADAEL